MRKVFRRLFFFFKLMTTKSKSNLYTAQTFAKHLSCAWPALTDPP